MTETKTTGVIEEPLDNIPEEMRRRRQWVAYKLEERDGRITKIPYIAGGGKASSTDSETWRFFEEAVGGGLEASA